MNQLLDRPHEPVKRAPWRQRLVDAETGLRIGIRTDGTLFVHFFCAGCILLLAVAVGLSAISWAMLILCLGMTFSVELFHQLCKQLINEYDSELSFSARQTLRLGTTAAMAAHLTGSLVIFILFWHRFVR